MVEQASPHVKQVPWARRTSQGGAQELVTAGYALSAEQDVITTVEALTTLGVRALGVPVDVTQWKQVQTMVDTVTQRLGPIDILCNNAGVIATGWVVETTEAQWDAMMQVNVKGVFLCCKAVAPGMMARRQGRIINTASIAGKRGNARAAAYYASKFAVIGFTQAFAHEMAPYNVTVNAVCPGILGTAMWLEHLIERRVEGMGDDRQATFDHYAASLMPLGRPQTPKDIGEAVVYLARAENVTGIALNVAGGLVMH
jgi:meso-butanediol dehydrogenase/(S,S)-butanediol dehydrogenase/diacetyl reductase